MLRFCLTLAVLLSALSSCQVANADLLGYWSADSTGGAGTVLPNDQGNADLDGELIGGAEYMGSGSGHTGQAGDYAIDFPGFDEDYVVIPATEETFDEITITAWVNGVQDSAWAGLVVSRASPQPIGLDFHDFDGMANYIWNDDAAETWSFISDAYIPDDEWTFVALTIDPDRAVLYAGPKGDELISGVNEIPHIPQDNLTEWRWAEDDGGGFPDRNFSGLMDDVSIWNEALTEEQLTSLFDGSETPLTLAGGGSQPRLLAGDADMNFEFNQLDLVKVQIAAKYLTGQAATWGDGDWNGAPGGSPDAPPTGNGLFDQLDIIAALAANTYLTGPYWPARRAALSPTPGQQNDGQASIVYDPNTGELAVDAPAGTELTSINIDSTAGIFTGDPAENLGGSFDNDATENIFKATFGSSFGSLSFGNVAQTGLSEDFLEGDLTVVGSLAGGGGLGDVDLVYVPEPTSIMLLAIGLAGAEVDSAQVTVARHRAKRSSG